MPQSKPIKWKLVTKKVSELKPYSKNPRNITEQGLKDLKKSVDKFGLAEPIVINTDNVIIGGHARFITLKNSGVKECDCYIPNRKLNDKEVEELNIRLNKNIAGTWDFDILANEFDMGELLEWGFTDKELVGVDFGGGKTDEELDDAPEPQKEAISKLGDIFLLGGKHRVMCGDSTKEADVSELCANSKADMVFTDPPYGMDFVGSVNGDGTPSANSKLQQIGNETGNELDKIEFIEKWLPRVLSLTDNAWYICYSRHNLRNLLIAFDELKTPVRNIIIWNKNRQNISNSDYKSKYELILYGWKKRNFYGTKGDNDVWEINKENKNELHPTQKPVALFAKAINNSSRRNEIVADLFLGSGGTLIACEETNRICHGMEISPQYIDVILRRYHKLYPEKEIECLNRKGFDFKKLFDA